MALSLDPKQKKETLETVQQVIQRASQITLITHMRPDADAYGSMLGLGLCLGQMGKRVRMWNEDGLLSFYRFLPAVEKIQKTPRHDENEDLVIALDTSSFERLGPTFASLSKAVDISIDHHAHGILFAKWNLILGDLPAAAAVVYELIQFAGWPMTPEIASCLFVGLSMDTGSFRYAGTTAQTFDLAKQLIEAGADPVALARFCYQSTPLARFKLLQLAFSAVQFESEGKLAYVQLEPWMFEKSGAQGYDTEGLVEKLLEIEPVQISVLFELQDGDLLKVSLRSKQVEVGKIAEEFGGGGHPFAAGIRTRGSEYQKILQRLRSELVSK